MDIFILQLINGLSLGSIYALVALGYSMVYGIVKLINFAHGDIIMVSCFTMYTAMEIAGLPLLVSIPLTLILTAVLGIIIEKLAYDRLISKGVERISLLITAIGVSIFLQSTFQLIFKADSLRYQAFLPSKTISLFGIEPSLKSVVTIIVSLVLMLALTLFVKLTKVGKAMRAASEDASAAKLMGINTSNVVAFTFAIGSLLAAVAGILYFESYPRIEPYMGGMLGLKAFVAAVIGGIGSIPGAMAGGLILGVAEAMTVSIGLSSYSDAVVFGILIIMLVLKPSGLFGKNIREKV
ncbi:MAG: branched-chain amino acid ABC transporter permease [Clostridiales bacterium]|nr:branched-chain amino acid ABC transporter permease [Clostridiales bacterium]